MQLLPVRGCDVWEPREDDPSKFRRVRVFHAFGPTDGLVPPLGTTLRVEPKSDDVRIVVCKYEDPNGRVRFTPTYPLRHTNN